MSSLLFLIDVAAMVLIAFWMWAVDRPDDAWRVRLFDVRDSAATETDASALSKPRWSRGEPGAETTTADVESPSTSFRRPQELPSSKKTTPRELGENTQSAVSRSRSGSERCR
jgi:hypothetical protein